MKSKKHVRRIKRRSSERKSSVKKTWEKFMKESDSRALLKEVWKVQDPQKECSERINKFHKKYCS